MSGDEMEITTFRPPDCARVTAQLVILAYMRDDGTNGYAVHAKGDMPSTTYLGLTVLAQEEIKGWGR
jgi:hypothetical protein